MPSSTVAPPEQLAHTGFTATLAVIGAGLLAAGIAVTRRNGAHRGDSRRLVRVVSLAPVVSPAIDEEHPPAEVND